MKIKNIVTPLLMMALMTGTSVAHAAEKCADGTALKSSVAADFKTVAAAIDIQETAKPLYEFLGKLTSEHARFIAKVYRTDMGAEKLPVVLSLPIESVKEKYKNLDLYISAATQGLHPHVYVSSCRREATGPECLTIDLLSNIDCITQLKTLVAKKCHELHERAIAAGCVAPQKKHEGFGAKAIEFIKTLVQNEKLRKAGKTLAE